MLGFCGLLTHLSATVFMGRSLAGAEPGILASGGRILVQGRSRWCVEKVGGRWTVMRGEGRWCVEKPVDGRAWRRPVAGGVWIRRPGDGRRTEI